MDGAEMPRSLGAVIKARRRELGWSQEELAKRIVMHGDVTFRQTDVSRLELGKVALPHRERLAHIAAVLGLSEGGLLARSGWAGAESVFLGGSPLPADSGSQFSAPDGSVQSHAHRARHATPSGVEAERLRGEIARAHVTAARSREILRQCEKVRARVDGLLDMGSHQRREEVRA